MPKTYWIHVYFSTWLQIKEAMWFLPWPRPDRGTWRTDAAAECLTTQVVEPFQARCPGSLRWSRYCEHGRTSWLSFNVANHTWLEPCPSSLHTSWVFMREAKDVVRPFCHQRSTPEILKTWECLKYARLTLLGRQSDIYSEFSDISNYLGISKIQLEVSKIDFLISQIQFLIAIITDISK